MLSKLARFLFLTIVVMPISMSARSDLYFLGAVGYARYRSENLQNQDLIPTGIDLHGASGYRFDMFSVEGFISKMSMKAKLNSAGQAYYLNYDEFLFGIAGKVYLDFFFMKLGYAIMKETVELRDYPNNSLTYSNSVADSVGADGVSRGRNGLVLGFGLDYKLTDSFGVLADTTLYDQNITSANLLSIYIGLSYHIDI